MRKAVAAVLCLGILAGCTGDAGDDGGKIRIVAAFYPLAEISERVGGDRVQVVNLTPPGAEPHDLELGPADIEAVSAADVVLFVGGGFQPALGDLLSTREGATIDALALTGGSDPHVWLDPSNLGMIAAALAADLADIDPESRTAFDRAAQNVVQEMESLVDAYASQLTECRSRVLVTAHDAFGVLAERFDLTVHPIAGISPEDEPTADRLAQLKQLVEREGVTTIFTETLVDPAIAETIARETGARTAVLNPIEGLTEAQLDAGESYITVMRDNLDALREGLGCA